MNHGNLTWLVYRCMCVIECGWSVDGTTLDRGHCRELF